MNLVEKQKIERKALEYVYDRDTIILDSGTTTYEIAKRINTISNITLIKNGINIAFELLSNRNVKLIIPGGVLKKTRFH